MFTVLPKATAINFTKTAEIFINISSFLKGQISQNVSLQAFLYKILICFCFRLVSFVFFVL